MANLLPYDIQQQVFTRSLTRAVVAASIIITFIGCIGIGAFLPAFITLQTQRDALQYQIAALDANQAAQQAGDATQVASINKEIAIAAGLSQQPQMVTDAISATIAARPTGTTLTRFEYASPFSTGATTSARLTISGMTARESDGTAFVNALQKNTLFTSVAIPISALAHTNINELTVELRGAF